MIMIFCSARHPAEMQYPGARGAAYDHFPRRQMNDRHPNADGIHPPKVPMSQGFAGYTVERYEYRQLLTRRANHSTAVVHGRVSPAVQHVVGLMSLRRQDQNVVDVELDLFRPTDRRQLPSDILIGCAQSQATFSKGVKMIASGDQHDLAPGQSQATAQRAADGSRAEDDVASHVAHRNLAQYSAMELRLRFRDLEPADLTDLDWSGGSEHIGAVAAALEASYAGEVALIVGCLPNDRLIAMGGVDFRPSTRAGTIWMLAVHERFQSLGAGAALITALEEKIIDHGQSLARMSVEHDNPRARALYERMGYVEAGATLDSWPVAGGRTYVTACTIMERSLMEVPDDEAAPS